MAENSFLNADLSFERKSIRRGSKYYNCDKSAYICRSVARMFPDNYVVQELWKKITGEFFLYVHDTARPHDTVIPLSRSEAVDFAYKHLPVVEFQKEFGVFSGGKAIIASFSLSEALVKRLTEEAAAFGLSRSQLLEDILLDRFIDVLPVKSKNVL